MIDDPSILYLALKKKISACEWWLSGADKSAWIAYILWELKYLLFLNLWAGSECKENIVMIDPNKKHPVHETYPSFGS
jgi:hypothetical protein